MDKMPLEKMDLMPRRVQLLQQRSYETIFVRYK